jgi:hypothetical protein
MPLAQLPESFDHADFIFEMKYDGFQALALAEDGNERLVPEGTKPTKPSRIIGPRRPIA